MEVMAEVKEKGPKAVNGDEVASDYDKQIKSHVSGRTKFSDSEIENSIDSGRTNCK